MSLTFLWRCVSPLLTECVLAKSHTVRANGCFGVRLPRSPQNTPHCENLVGFAALQLFVCVVVVCLHRCTCFIFFSVYSGVCHGCRGANLCVFVCSIFVSLCPTDSVAPSLNAGLVFERAPRWNGHHSQREWQGHLCVVWRRRSQQWRTQMRRVVQDWDRR